MSKQQIPGDHPAQRDGCSAGGWSCWCQLAMEAGPLRAPCRTALEIHMEILRADTESLASITPVTCG